MLLTHNDECLLQWQMSFIMLFFFVCFRQMYDQSSRIIPLGPVADSYDHPSVYRSYLMQPLPSSPTCLQLPKKLSLFSLIHFMCVCVCFKERQREKSVCADNVQTNSIIIFQPISRSIFTLGNLHSIFI